MVETNRPLLGVVLREAYTGGRGSDAFLDAVGFLVVGRIKGLLSQPGTGRLYGRRGAGRPPHRASAPGEPPAVDTGRYRASFNHRTGRDSDGPWVEVGTNDERGPWFEMGTSRMAPRPHLRRAIDEVLPAIGPVIEKGQESKLRGAARARGGG